MKPVRLQQSLFLLLVLLLFSAQGCRSESNPPGSSTIVQAPEFELTDLDGKDVRFSDYSGKVVILNFWATWCYPCRIEIPHLVDLYSRYRSKGLEVVGIALDTVGTEVLKEFSFEMGISYPILVGDEKISSDYGGVFGIPTTFVINRDGMITNRYIGLADSTALEREILPLL